MNFFGLADNQWREDLLEEYFLLQMHLNMSYSDIRSLPIQYRRWFIKRITKHFEQKKAVYNSTSDTSSSQKNDESNFDMEKVNKFFKSKFK